MAKRLVALANRGGWLAHSRSVPLGRVFSTYQDLGKSVVQWAARLQSCLPSVNAISQSSGTFADRQRRELPRRSCSSHSINSRTFRRFARHNTSKASPTSGTAPSTPSSATLPSIRTMTWPGAPSW